MKISTPQSERLAAYRARRAIGKTLRVNKFIAEYIDKPSLQSAAEAAGITLPMAKNYLNDPANRKRIEAAFNDAAIYAGINRAWVIARLKEVAERCMQSTPVLDSRGRETGMYTFDASGANRSLELIGKHLKVWDDSDSANAQLGAAVIRVLAQEAQTGRHELYAMEGQIVDPPSDRVPSTEKTDGTEKNLSAFDPPANQISDAHTPSI